MKRLLFLLMLFTIACQKGLSYTLNDSRSDNGGEIVGLDDTVHFDPLTEGGNIIDDGNPGLICSSWDSSITGNDFDSAFPKRFKFLITKSSSVHIDSLIIYVDAKRFRKVPVTSDTVEVTIAAPRRKGIPKLNPANAKGTHYLTLRKRGNGNSKDFYRIDLLEATFINKHNNPQTLFNITGIPENGLKGITCSIR